jgi:hypothetical protein
MRGIAGKTDKRAQTASHEVITFKLILQPFGN